MINKQLHENKTQRKYTEIQIFRNLDGIFSRFVIELLYTMIKINIDYFFNAHRKSPMSFIKSGKDRNTT